MADYALANIALHPTAADDERQGAREREGRGRGRGDDRVHHPDGRQVPPGRLPVALAEQHSDQVKRGSCERLHRV